MRVIRPYTTLRVQTTDGRLRHAVVLTVTDQDTITARIGLVGNGVTVSATRQASTTTRGTLFVQA